MKNPTLLLVFISMFGYAQTTIKEANRTGFTYFSPQENNYLSFGYGFTAYSAAWALFENYPGSLDFQVGLGSQWMKPQLTGNEPEDFRNKMQNRIELIHSNWSHTDEYIQPPAFGELATIDSKIIVQPPAGLEIGYVPIVTKQEQSTPKVRVFILAGQSNMQGYGLIEDNENDPGSLINVIQNDTDGEWSEIGGVNNWNTLEGVLLYSRGGDIKTNATVGQGVGSNYIGPELMFAHQLDAYYDDPVLIIKTATGGTNLAVNWRPPSAGGETGELYSSMIQTIQNVTQNLGTEFPDIGTTDFEISGFTWFQGWSDAGDESRRNEYESNLTHLIHDVRSDLNIPDLPVIIANSGHGGYRPSDDQMVQYLQNNISVSQKNVGTNDSIYGGKVGFVETKKHWQELSESPTEAIHHFHENARLYLNIGKDIGNEMIKAINDASYYNEEDCNGEIIPDFVSLGNRVWNDINKNGINEPDEPGISGVSVQLWRDTNGDGVPNNTTGLEVTDSEGYYKFINLEPGYYQAGVHMENNWGLDEPLEDFISTRNFVSNADNDIDLDNNGFGSPGSDIRSGIINLIAGEEPLDEFDEDSCYYNYDPSGNNSVDFGFYEPGEDCEPEHTPDFVSLGNRVWNDYNRNGINDANEPGIPGVSVFLHSDTDGDGIPDGLQGAAGFEITDSEGYYKFTNLEPGPYKPFIWSVNNWRAGEPLEGFIYTNNFVSNADNNVDLDNNGSGDPGTDGEPIIIILTAGEEPIDGFDENDCFYDYDPSGNNSVDFGFYDPSIILAVTSSGSGIDLQENSGAAQSVYTITAAGAFGVASYSISGDDASSLSVNTETGVVSLDADPDYETKNSYIFTATANDAEGNTSAAIIVTFNITEEDSSLGVEDEVTNKNEIQFFPNPILNKLTVKGNFISSQLKIFDSLGRILQTIKPMEPEYTIDMSKMLKGVYFIKVFNNKNVLIKTQKIIKE